MKEENKEKDTLYVYLFEDYLAGSYDKPKPDTIQPTFKQAMRISPNYIAYAAKGETLVFEDMTIEIIENRKHIIEDGELAKDYFNDTLTAEEGFKQWGRLLKSVDNGERLKFLTMVYNAGFNAGTPIDLDDLENY